MAFLRINNNCPLNLSEYLPLFFPRLFNIGSYLSPTILTFRTSDCVGSFSAATLMLFLRTTLSVGFVVALVAILPLVFTTISSAPPFMVLSVISSPTFVAILLPALPHEERVKADNVICNANLLNFI
ncbi:hypothetical protein SDC9_115909 [bioreactor metagenome]|uniref:Uncharacterized protein n=1 Tax=bioreactor metagenome TaxID=1076179 RepID=A0A645BUP0_9ZZZZ